MGDCSTDVLDKLLVNDLLFAIIPEACHPILLHIQDRKGQHGPRGMFLSINLLPTFCRVLP